MDGAVVVPAEVGVFESVLMGDVDALIRDEHCEPVHRVRIGAKKGSE